MLMSYAVDEFCRFAKSVEVTEDDSWPQAGRILSVMAVAQPFSATLLRLHIGERRRMALWGGGAPTVREMKAIAWAWGGWVDHYIIADDGVALPPWPDVPTKLVDYSAAACPF